MKKFLMLLGLFALTSSCQDLYEVVAPQVEVTTEKKVYKVNEAITFQIEGQADLINFFSGTQGNAFAYRDEDRIYDIVPGVSFRSSKAPAGGTDVDIAELYYTTDFDGNYAYENVKDVDWIPISDRFDLQDELQDNATDYAESGKVAITDLFESGEPVYLAWRCHTQAGAYRTQFRVVDFYISDYSSAQKPDDSNALYTLNDMAFQWVWNEAVALDETQPTITNTRIFWNGTFNNTNGPFKEGYAVSGPLTFEGSANLGRDKPIVVKTVDTENITEYTYSFDTPGDYEVVFVTYNVNHTGKQEVVKRIPLTIEE